MVLRFPAHVPYGPSAHGGPCSWFGLVSWGLFQQGRNWARQVVKAFVDNTLYGQEKRPSRGYGSPTEGAVSLRSTHQIFVMAPNSPDTPLGRAWSFGDAAEKLFLVDRDGPVDESVLVSKHTLYPLTPGGD